MQPHEYTTMHRYEDNYWWYSGLRRLISPVLKNYFPSAAKITLLDAGCGTGGNLVHLRQILNQAKLFAMDIYPLAIRLTNSRKTGTALLQASVNKAPFKEDIFDVITCFDVLCIHGINDLEAFREFHRTLKPGGVLLINLPACELLRGEHDAAVHTRHRYTARELRTKLRSAGFVVKRITHWNTLLSPLLLIRRRISAWKKVPKNPRSDFRPLPSWINEALKFVLRIEETVISFFDLPFGASVFAVAQKIL